MDLRCWRFQGVNVTIEMILMFFNQGMPLSMDLSIAVFSKYAL